MSLLVFHRLPRSITMRELRVRIDKKGFRTKQFVVVTSLLDPVTPRGNRGAESPQKGVPLPPPDSRIAGEKAGFIVP